MTSSLLELLVSAKNQYGQNLTCYFCSNEDTQSHILFCKELISDMNTSGVHDEHTFSDSITEQENVAKLLDKILKKRILKIKLLSTDKNFSHWECILSGSHAHCMQCLVYNYLYMIYLYMDVTSRVSTKTVPAFRDLPNPNNSDESEFIRKRIVPFLINRIEIMNIRIRLLINQIGVCSIRVIPIRNRIHWVNIPYEPNNTRIFQMVKYI